MIVEHQMTFFDDNSPEGLIRQDMILLISEVKKTHRALFARDATQKRQISDLKAELAEVKKRLGMELHRNEPLFIFSSEK